MKTAGEAREKGLVLIGGGNVWGVGKDLAAAKRQFNRNGGRLLDGYEIVVFDQDTSFDGLDSEGGFYYTGNAPTITKVKERPSRKDSAA